jgi:CPA1 family monovalent cation:H+ antiporter
MCTYALAVRLEMSGPLATVATGLYFGNKSNKALSLTNQSYLKSFWTIVDELINSVLFLLIGFEVLLVYQRLDHLSFALLAIPVCLSARWLSVRLSLSLLSYRTKFAEGTSAILTWGGLRGGIAVALALNLPEESPKGIILSTTYAVVVFSILIQGLTLRPIGEKILQPGQRDVK